MKDMVTVPEAVAEFGLLSVTIRSWLVAGLVAGVRGPGGFWKVSRKSLQAQIAGGPPRQGRSKQLALIATMRRQLAEMSRMLAASQAAYMELKAKAKAG